MSAAEEICAYLKRAAGISGLEKWGWIIYRTTYGDEEAWARFRARVERETRAAIAELGEDAADIADTLEWKWVEDQETLDGASTEALRERFQRWRDAESARISAETGRERLGFVVPYHWYFVQVDEEALQSVSDEPAGGWDAPGAHVKFVDSETAPLAEIWETRDRDDMMTEEEEEELGIEKDVGWMRISPYMLNAELYALGGAWHVFYKRPPQTVNLSR